MRTFVITMQVGDRPARSVNGIATRGALVAGKMAQSIADALGTMEKKERVVLTLTISESDQSSAAS